MTLMVNGKKVVGYALGGTEFYSMKENADGSISLNGQDYLSKNSMKLKGTGQFSIGTEFSHYSSSFVDSSVDVTNQLSNHEGNMAICIISSSDNSFTVSQPIMIPTAPTDNLNLSFDVARWSGSLSMDSSSSTLTFKPNDENAASDTTATGQFYVLSNN